MKPSGYDRLREPHLCAEIDRLNKRIKNQRREIEVLRHVLVIVWTRSKNRWKIVGEGKQAHINDDRGCSYLGVTNTDGGKILISSAEQVRVIKRALIG